MKVVTLPEKSKNTIEKKISPTALELAGRNIFGRQWQSPLAMELGVTDRTMRRWAISGAPVDIVWGLREMIGENMDAAHRALVLLKEY